MNNSENERNMLVKRKSRLISPTSRKSLIEKVNDLQPFIGNTPLFPIEGLVDNPNVTLYAKLEWNQLGNSVKARPAYNIIKEAILSGQLNRRKSILDASSGNTGVAYGAIGAALGIPVTLCLPENASEQKQNSLKSFGVNIVYTSKFDSTDGAQEKALELFMEFPDKYFYADQYVNDNNWKAHYQTTAVEIYNQSGRSVTHFVAGLGTTGTFTGTGRGLKEFNRNIEIIALHPDSALHGMEGWKHLETAKVPAFYDENLADRNIDISTEEAYEYLIKMAKTNGLLISPSSAANLAGALKVARELDKGVVVTVFPDHGNNYPEVLRELIN